MYQGRTLSDLAKELERQAATKKDFKAPTNLLGMTTTTDRNLEFIVGDKFSGPLTELMHDQVGSTCGIPGKYYDRCRTEHPELLVAQVNAWLHDKKETMLVRTLDQRARALLSNRYRTIDNSDVAEAVLPVLVQESQKLGSIKVVSSEVTERKLYIKAISNRLTFDVKKGDVVQAGVVISNSEVGLASVKIEPILFRLICDNGAIIEDSAVRKFHVGRQSAELEAAEQVFRDETRRLDDKVFVMKLQDVMRSAFDDANFEKLKGTTIDSTTRKIKAPIQDVVEEVASRYALSDGHKDSFLKNLIEGGDTSQWGLANAITAVANTAENYEAATNLERIGGEIITMSGNQWRELADAA